MRRTFALGLAALVFASPAHAQQWTHLGTVGDEWEIYFDRARLARTGPAVRFWVRRAYVQGRGNGDYYLSETEIDCAARTARVLLTITHRPDGSEAARDGVPVAAEPFPPNSLYEQIRQQIC